MTKYHNLFAGTITNTEIQVVKENQLITSFGYAMCQSEYVVYKVEHSNRGYVYHMINLDTKEILRNDIVEPLSRKFGIGLYYDDITPKFMDASAVAVLIEEAQKKATAKAEETEKERQRIEACKAIGRKRMTEILPEDAKALIVAYLEEDESDIQTDYHASRTVRTIILGFSTHTRDIFSEMRRYAVNYSATAFLAEPNEDYENREKYSMGAGYYLGRRRYSGWQIRKVRIYDRSRTIEEFAYTAGNEDNIHIGKATAVRKNENVQTPAGEFVVVDYSEKCIAVFGDTKPIKTELYDLGGRYNGHLTHNGQKMPGWVFQKVKEPQVREYLKLTE